LAVPSGLHFEKVQHRGYGSLGPSTPSEMKKFLQTTVADVSSSFIYCYSVLLSHLFTSCVYFLANVNVKNSRSRSLYAVARPSVVCLPSVCNARAPYSGGCNFRQFFDGTWYLGHPLTST